MKFGISTFVNEDSIDTMSLARAIEERGFESLVIAEHTHIPASRETPYPGGGELPQVYYRTLDPFVTLAAARRRDIEDRAIHRYCVAYSA
jgi:alkanesulfonate monooxygenase SsuD/methylene tetrahydromethanopterin reductase-like flavin-dependent oxidoreductase (luciferase family)